MKIWVENVDKTPRLSFTIVQIFMFLGLTVLSRNISLHKNKVLTKKWQKLYWPTTCLLIIS